MEGKGVGELLGSEVVGILLFIEEFNSSYSYSVIVEVEFFG